MTAEWEAAIRQGDLETATRLVHDPTLLDSRDRHGQTGLMLAAHAGHHPIVSLLVHAGAALDVTAKHGLSALMLAIIGGHPEVARELAGAGADVRIRGRGAPGFAGRTAIDLARERGWAELARELAEGSGTRPPDAIG